MNRLRTVPYLQPSLLFLGKIVFLDTCSLHKHIDIVRNDINLKVAVVNIFADT